MPSNLFQWVTSSHQVVKVLELQLQHQSFQLIFRADFQLFFIVQLLHLYMTTGKTIAWTRWTFVGKVMSLLFNTLSRLVIAFLPRSKRLLISWLQSPYSVIFGALENKVCHCSHCFPIYLPWSGGTRSHDLCFLNADFKANRSLSFFTFYQEAL